MKQNETSVSCRSVAQHKNYNNGHQPLSAATTAAKSGHTLKGSFWSKTLRKVSPGGKVEQAEKLG